MNNYYKNIIGYLLKNNQSKIRSILFICTSCFFISFAQAEAKAPCVNAVVTPHPLATAAGVDILEQGGNAFDAAVAVAAALAVVEPYNSGIGGGGFWLLYDASADAYAFVDARETAPSALHADSSLTGLYTAGIPGMPAALSYLTKHYSSLPLAQLLVPAIGYAKEGFAVDESYQEHLLRYNAITRVQKYVSSAEIFLQEGDMPSLGYLIKQPDLANVLEGFANHGVEDFYRGELAEKLVRAVEQYGGVWKLEDLAEYELVLREPLELTLPDEIKIVTAPLPSSGGIGIITMLRLWQIWSEQVLPDDNTCITQAWAGQDQTSEILSLNIIKISLLIEAMRLAYKDRFQYLADPDFFDVPVQELLSEAHIQTLARQYQSPSPSSVPSEDIKSLPISQGNTTHFNVIDAEGNMVAATLSLNYMFGSGFVVPGAGILLNNQLADFTQPPNHVEPGKRPLSSMSPTIVYHRNRVAILGSPGSQRIPTIVWLEILAFLCGQPPNFWVGLPLFHHQYVPDEVVFEPDAFSPELQAALSEAGYVLKQHSRTFGNPQAILWDRSDNTVMTASAPCGIGEGVVLGRVL